MRLLHLPENQSLAFYLAAEEYLSEHGSEAYFFVWQTRPTVIIGHHQVLEDEVNLPYCRAHSVDIFRRKSGGGCVYSDEGNLMLSCISRNPHPQEAFSTFLDTLVRALQRLGFAAVTTAHNDVLIDHRKVSGSACHTTPSGTIVHSTLLLSSNVEALQQAITPSAEKLSHNGVQSVRQRVVTLAELGQTDKSAILRSVISTFCDDLSPLSLSADDLSAIRAIEETYDRL